MAYTVHNFEQGDVLYANQLNEMDAQIAANEESIGNSVSSDMLAEDYSANKTYSIGDYVIYNNELYTCIYEITAPERWNSAHWEIANLGDGISDLNRQLSDVEETQIPELKSALESEDAFTNDVLSYVNYGYDTPFYQAEGSGAWHKTTGITRDKQIITLNRHATYSGTIRIKVSGAVEQAANNAMIDAWSTGLSLIAGHKYVATIKLLSGTSYMTDPESIYIPGVAIYRAGLHTGWSVPERTDNIAKTTFTAENNTQYNLAILLESGEWNLTDAKFLLTLVDVTASRIDAVEKAVSDIPYFFNGDYVVARVEENTDYDTITVPGTYRVETKAIAESMTHCPVEVGHKLYVFQTSAASLLYQVIFPNSSKTRIFIRNKHLSDADFTSWKYINLTDTDNILIDNVPEYYFNNDYLESRIEAILANNKNVGLHSDSLIFFTDPHVYRDGDITKTQNGLQAANLIEYVVNRTNIHQIVCGGDLTNGNTMTSAQQIALLKQIRVLYSPIWEKLYMIIGNHEWNNPANISEQEANMLTINQLYPLLVKDKEREYGDIEPTMGNYWIDNPTQKIRYFYLSCTSGGNIGYNQLKWFAKQMELIPAEYTVFVLSHIGILTDTETGDPIYCGRFAEIANILDAVKAKSTYSYLYPGTSVPITGDYTSLVDVIVAGVLCGHKHLDFSMYTDGGIPIISTACDRGPKSDSTDLIKVAREYGTIGEQLIDVVQIDITNRKIYLTRIGGCTTGAGYDAETGLLYDTAVGTGTEYTGTEWTIYNPYKDREFVF